MDDKVLDWFDRMVKLEAIDPFNLDMTLVPNAIFSRLKCERNPEGLNPNKTTLTVALMLLMRCEMLRKIKGGNPPPTHIDLPGNQVMLGINSFAILVYLERLRRRGLLRYNTTASWHDGSGEVVVFGCDSMFSDMNVFHFTAQAGQS
ncbi:MAG: hypothetical protein WAL98_05460 [Desulfatiglandaceae bacterium]